MSRRLLLAAVVLAGLWGLLAWACMPYYPVGIFNDDARFVLRGYQILGWEPSGPGDEVGLYSPGHGLLLAAALAVAGPEDLEAVRWLPVLCMLAAAALLGLLARRWLPPLGALGVAACFLLNPVAATLGSTLLADPPWLALSLASLVLATRMEEGRPRLGYAVGLLAGAGVLFRPEGWIVPGALVLWLAGSRRWAALPRVLLGIAPPLAAQFLLSPLAHAAQVTGYGAGFGWILANAGSFLVGLPRLLGAEYLGLPGSVATVGGAAFLALALVGLGRERPWSPLLLLAGGILAVQFVWPFPDARYLLLVWPCVVLLGGLAPGRPERAVAVAGVALLLTSPALLATVRTSSERAAVTGRWASYAWLREHSDPQALTASPFAVRVRLLARRPSVQPQPAALWCQLLADACARKASFLFWEPAFQLRRDFQGRSQVELPARAELWMDSSSLVRPVAGTPWDRVYRIEVDREAFLRAFELYLAAGRLDWNREAPRAERLLREALARVPDFPEAESSLALVLLQGGEARRAEALRLLEGVVARYPVDVDSAYNLGLALAQAGRADEARAILESGRERALGLGFPEKAGAFEGALGALR